METEARDMQRQTAGDERGLSRVRRGASGVEYCGLGLRGSPFICGPKEVKAGLGLSMKTVNRLVIGYGNVPEVLNQAAPTSRKKIKGNLTGHELEPGQLVLPLSGCVARRTKQGTQGPGGPGNCGNFCPGTV